MQHDRDDPTETYWKEFSGAEDWRVAVYGQCERGSIDISSDEGQKHAVASRLGGWAIGAVTCCPLVRASPDILDAPIDLEPLGDADACAKGNEKIAVEGCHIGHHRPCG